MDHEKPTVCVLDASTYVGFWILKRLLSRGYTVHAALQKKGKCFCFFFFLGTSFFELVSLFFLKLFLFWGCCRIRDRDREEY